MYTSLKKLSNIQIIKQEGTSRPERYMPALHASTGLMDNRSIQEMIAYMQRFAKNLLFISPDAELSDSKENWEGYFKNDILFLVANVSAKNVQEIRSVYDKLYLIFEGERTVENFLELAQYAYARLKTINDWYIASFPDPLLKNNFTLYIRSYLQNELGIVREMLMYGLNQVDEGEKTSSLRNEMLHFDEVWNLPDNENFSLREKIFAGKEDAEKLTHASLLLYKTFNTIFHATEMIVHKCNSYFEEAIQLKQDYHHNHNPHVALIIAFLKLYQYVKADLNKVPERHLQFYYRDVLKIKARKAMPDETFLVFELAKGFEPGLIKKGTRVSAGKDKENRELVYETQKDIIISNAQPAALHTIYTDRNASGEVLNYYKSGFTGNIGHVPATSSKRNGVSRVFGEPITAGISGVGFAIASSQFYLSKGERNLLITIDASEDSISSSNDADGAGGSWDSRIIRVLFTGEKGWIDSDSPTSGITVNAINKKGNAGVELSISISIRQEQAIVAFDSILHSGNFNTSFPVLQCMLKYPNFSGDDSSPERTREQISQLSMLQNLQVSAISVAVQVGSIGPRASFNGVKDLMLENDESPLDVKKPFFPFTAVPKVGSSFYIGCKDLFYKKIQELSVNMEWVLPENFSAYYQRYLPPYDLNKFMVSLSSLKGKQWKKIFDTPVIDGNANEPKFRSIRLKEDKLSKVDGNTSSTDEVFSFDNLKKDGTLRLKLNYPDFGHSVYPQLITSAVMEGAREKSGGADYYKILRNQLNDSVISIKYPDDIRIRTGSLKVIYDILENVKNITPGKARTMMIRALSEIILKYNLDNLVTRKREDEDDDDGPGRMLVNDPNWLDRFLGIFRKIGIVDKSVHYDKDKDELDDVADNLIDKVQKKSDFIMPSDDELIDLIENETNTAINNAVSNMVDDILVLVKQGKAEPDEVGAIMEREFSEVNGVINDMIAKKIALHIATNDIPRPPYTPLISAVSISYASNRQLSASDGDILFHITPFGVVETGLLAQLDQRSGINAPVRTDYLLPKRLISTDRDYQGMTFIGIKDLVLNQNLSLLVQLAEGPTTSDKKPPLIHWYYLRNYQWIAMNNESIVSDSTYGLQTTGIIEFSIPQDANNRNILFDVEELFWLCAAVEKDTDAFQNLVDIKSQAVLASYRDYKTNPLHLALPLGAETIKTLIDDIPRVKKVSQPVSSFSGQVEENEKEYFTRVSERLRHKSRAINNWDYERLVLEQFPSFYKVKCLNNYYRGDFAIGHITVIPIADFRNKKYAGSNMLVPKVNYRDLRSIEEFLVTKCSPFAKIHAINPLLEHVLITCRVKFHAHVNKGFYLKKLNEDLINFLTPWATGDDVTVSFSAKVYASSIINFIDRQEYVNYVVDLVMEQYTEAENDEKKFVRNAVQLTALVETELKTGHSILVSAPSHQIELVDDDTKPIVTKQ